MAYPKRQIGQSLAPAYTRIAKRIGTQLREVYGPPEADPLPVEHVELLLQLRHKERERNRTREPA